jgi:hypothetical protein
VDKKLFTEEDVLAYLEQKIIDEDCTDKEYQAYINYQSSGIIDQRLYGRLYKEMKFIYNGFDK